MQLHDDKIHCIPTSEQSVLVVLDTRYYVSEFSSKTQHEPSLPPKRRFSFLFSSAFAIPLRNNSLNFNRQGVLPPAPRGITTGSAFIYLITHELHSGAPNNKPERHPGDDLSRLTGFFLHYVCAVCACVCMCACVHVCTHPVYAV